MATQEASMHGPAEASANHQRGVKLPVGHGEQRKPSPTGPARGPGPQVCEQEAAASYH